MLFWILKVILVVLPVFIIFEWVVGLKFVAVREFLVSNIISKLRLPVFCGR